MSKKLYLLASFALLLALALSLIGARQSFSLASPGLDRMPPHPDFIKRLKAEGYSSVTIVNMLKQNPAVDQPATTIPTGVTGVKQALVLLVDFSDQAANVVSTQQHYQDMLFSLGTYTAPGSMRDFYQANSYGLFDVQGTVTSWFRAAHPYTYYSANYGEGTWPANAPGLVSEVAQAANASVNFANFAEGGVVKSLFVVHSGAGAETGASGAIWSHSWSIVGGGGTALTLDGVTVNAYTIEPEYVWAAGDSTMGVFAHEYGHALGLPDLYDTSNVTEGIGDWSLMAGGSWNGTNGDSPANMDAWCKIKLGWLTPITPTTDQLSTTIAPSETNAVAYKLWTNGVTTGKQYFLVENRQLTGFDAALPGAGLLIYHVDDNKASNSQQCSQQNNWLCGATHAWVAVEQADGLYNLEHANNRGDAGDPFPGTTSKTSFTSATNPNTSSYLSSAATYVKVTGISQSGLNIIASLYVKAPVVTIPTPQKPTGTITDTTPTYQWTKVTGATQYRYQLYKGTTLVYTKTVTSAVCATVCTNTPTTVLAYAAYKWHVQALVGGTWGSYSAYKTFTVAKASTKPKAGLWGNGTWNSFYVTTNQASVSKFAITVNVTGCGTYKITRTLLSSIVSNKFSFSGTYYATGTFLTTTSAKGTTGLSSFYIAGCGYVSTGGAVAWSSIWRSAAQPIVAQVDTTPVVIEAALPGTDAITVEQVEP